MCYVCFVDECYDIVLDVLAVPKGNSQCTAHPVLSHPRPATSDGEHSNISPKWLSQFVDEN